MECPTLGDTVKKIPWFELVGAMAVVLSLLFVAYEVRQANKLALVANVAAHYASFSPINEALMTDPELTSLLHRAEASSDLAEFSQPERMQIASFIRMLLNTWIPANISYNNGQLAQASFDAVFDDARASLRVAGPAMRDMWKEVVYTYPGLSDVEIIAFLRAEIEASEGLNP